MKMHFTKMLSVCCAILFGAFYATDAQAQGNTCGTALAVTPGSYTADGPSDGVSSTICETTAGPFADWYSFTPTANGLLSVNSCDGGADTQLSIFSGTCAALVCEGSSDDATPCISSGTSNFASRVDDLSVMAGTTYYIQWDNDWTTAGFDWSLTFTELTEPDCEGVVGGLALPGTPCDDNDAGTVNDTWDADCNCVGIPAASNDTPCTATALACGDTVFNQNFIGATAFIDDPCSGSGTLDVFYSFSADGTQNYNISVLDIPGTFFDGVVELYEGADCNNLVLVEECSDFPEDFDVTAAGDYTFRVRAWSSAETDFFNIALTCTPFDCPGIGNIGDACDDGNAGTVDDQIQEDCTCAGTPPVSNDTPCTATALACGDTVFDQNFIGATAFIDDPCSGSGTLDVFYSFSADGTQSYNISVLDVPGTFFDGVVELYEGSDCNNLVLVEECSDFPEDFDVNAAGDYTFRVRAWSSTETDFFNIALTCTPFDCPGIGNIGDPCDDGDSGTVNDEIQADCSCLGEPVAANNRPCTATAVACGDTLLGQSLAGATEFGSDDCGGSGVVDVYYSFTADGTQSYRIAVLDPSFVFDGVVELLEGSDCNDLTVAAACDDFPEEFTVTAAGNYYFRVRAFSSTEADGFDITLECTPFDCPGVGNIGDACDDGDPLTIGSTIQTDCSCGGGFIPPANDNCADVTFPFVLQCDEVLTGSTQGATSSGLDAACNGFNSSTPEDTWYAFQANGTSDYTITVLPTESSQIDAVLFVYSGTCGSLTEIACQDTGFSLGSGEALEIEVPASGLYYVRVFNWASGGAEYTVGLTCVENCQAPFPAVDEASLVTTPSFNGFQTQWAPVPGQIGCQVQVRPAGGPGLLGAQILVGANVGSLTVPGNFLTPGTDYEWRVRCGCSQQPFIVGPFTTWQPYTTPGGAAITSMPNPTEGQSYVTFTVVEEGYTTLEVFDMSGRMVDAIFTGNAQPNNDYRFEFDGSALPNGVYIYRLTTESEVVNDKFMIAR